MLIWIGAAMYGKEERKEEVIFTEIERYIEGEGERRDFKGCGGSFESVYWEYRREAEITTSNEAASGGEGVWLSWTKCLSG